MRAWSRRLLGEFAIDPRTVSLSDFRQHRASVRMPAHHPEMAAFLRAEMTKRGIPIVRPTDDELYERMYGACGHGANINPPPPGGTLADRCKPGVDLRNVQRGNVPLPEYLVQAVK